VMKFETLSEIYTPEVQSALRRYKEHLDDTRMRLRQREMAATETLAKYEMAGNDMPEIADRYRSILKDMKTVKADISRLGGNV
ncbi:MAG: hypothetical protein M1830_005061, partial [Pleopsidium flavum]